MRCAAAHGHRRNRQKCSRVSPPEPTHKSFCGLPKCRQVGAVGHHHRQPAAHGLQGWSFRARRRHACGCRSGSSRATSGCQFATWLAPSYSQSRPRSFGSRRTVRQSPEESHRVPTGSINSEEMARRAVDWIVNKGVRCIYVDHMGEVEHLRRSETTTSGAAWRWRGATDASETSASNCRVPVVALAHTNRELRAKFGEEPRPPRLNRNR